MANSSEKAGKNYFQSSATALIRDGRLVRLDDASDRNEQALPLVYVPSEDVALFSVDLPMKNRRQRLQALPFALEERIAQPLETVHIASGRDVGGQAADTDYIAAVVSHTKMQEWRALVEAAGLARCRLVPDCLALPVAGPETWIVAISGERAVIRSGYGLGFAAPVCTLPDFWRAAGKPAIAIAEGSLPEEMTDAVIVPLSDDAGPEDPVLDLCQGAYARKAGAVDRRATHIAAIVGIAASLLLALMIIDVMALRGVAADREEELRTRIASMNGNRPVPSDLARAATQLLPSQGEAGAFLPLMTKIADALPAGAGAISMRSVSFDDRAGTLTMEVEAEDLAALQDIEAALVRGGLQPDTGAATTADGAATQRITVRMPGGAA